MSTHAFEVLSRARNEIDMCHTAELYRFKFLSSPIRMAREFYLNRSRWLPKRGHPYA
jgi:hypothetical protein